MKRKHKNLGQSSIEFIMVFGISIGFFIIFLSLGINLTFGYIVHYATYDVSRAYLVIDNASQVVVDAQRNAATTAEGMVAFRGFTWNRILSSSYFRAEDITGFNFNQPDDVIPEFVGVHYNYKRRLSDSGFVTGTQRVEYTSESFLGKEPVRAECYERICERMDGACSRLQDEVTVFDNGC